MSRIGYIARNPKALAGALGTLLVAAGLTAGSGAVLTDSDSSAANSVTAGTADIVLLGSAAPNVDGNNCRHTGGTFTTPANYVSECTNEGVDSGQKLTFSVSHLVPGAPKITRCFAIKNNSDVPMGLKLDVDRTDAVAANDSLADRLKITVARQAVGGLNGTFIPTSGSYLSGHESQGFVVADGVGNNNSTPRRAMEPQETYKYCLQLEVLENNQNQNAALAGKSVTFDVNARAESLNGAL